MSGLCGSALSTHVERGDHLCPGDHREEQLPEAVTALLKSKAQEEPQPPELRPEGKLLYCCTQLPADGQLPEDAVVLLCSDEPCAGEGVCRFTPEDMQEILGKWMWN